MSREIELSPPHRAQKAAPVDVHAGMNVGEAFETIVLACLKHYRLNEPLVLRESKAAALHQCRVAMRRLRSAFALFRPAIDDGEFRHLRHELRRFTSQLGHARNLDVYLKRDMGDEERARLIRKREKAYDQVVEAMNSHKLQNLLIYIAGWAAIGAWRSAKRAQPPIESFASGRLDQLWASIAAAERDVGSMGEAGRHKLRIRVKKLRYASEFLRNLYPHARAHAKRFGSGIEDLQESLGKLNDLATAKSLGAPIGESWLFGSPKERHLIAAEEALRDLLGTRPFWREPEEVEPA